MDFSLISTSDLVRLPIIIVTFTLLIIFIAPLSELVQVISLSKTMSIVGIVIAKSVFTEGTTSYGN